MTCYGRRGTDKIMKKSRLREYRRWWDKDGKIWPNTDYDEIQITRYKRRNLKDDDILKLEYYRNKRYEIWNELQMIKYRTWAMNDEILKVTRYELSNW